MNSAPSRIGVSMFKVGDLYSATQIQNSLEVGNAGGIRVSLHEKGDVRRLVLLTSLPSARIVKENPYHDRIEGDVLVYAGAGLQGDQSLGGANKRIPLQAKEQFPIYGFRLGESRRKTGIRRWEFLGLLQFLRHYPDTQIDNAGVLRRIWIFEFRVCQAPRIVHVEGDQLAMRAAVKTHTQPESSDQIVIPAGIQSADSNVPADAESVERVRRRLLGLAPSDFERVVKGALSRTGFERVEVTKYSQDGGIDVDAYVADSFWPLAGLHLQVQAKRWLHTVGRREVAELRGSLSLHARGAVVTTSHFSRAAIGEASGSGKAPIILVDGYSFASTVMSLGNLEILG